MTQPKRKTVGCAGHRLIVFFFNELKDAGPRRGLKLEQIRPHCNFWAPEICAQPKILPRTHFGVTHLGLPAQGPEFNLLYIRP